MSLLVLSLGSNIQRRKHMRYALRELTRCFGELLQSPLYQSRSVGFDGPDFYNMVVAVETPKALEEVVDAVREIERQAGRVRGEKRFESRSIDIDVLLYGAANLRARGWDIPREEIEHAAYVLRPLADLLPDMHHPVSHECFSAMWDAFDDLSQPLERVSL